MMAEQLNLLGYVVWQVDRWEWSEINRAILRYQERTGHAAEVIAYRAGDRAKLRPLVPDRFEIRFWETDGPTPGFIWVMDAKTVSFYQNVDRSGASAIQWR